METQQWRYLSQSQIWTGKCHKLWGQCTSRRSSISCSCVVLLLASSRNQTIGRLLYIPTPQTARVTDSTSPDSEAQQGYSRSFMQLPEITSKKQLMVRFTCFPGWRVQCENKEDAAQRRTNSVRNVLQRGQSLEALLQMVKHLKLDMAAFKKCTLKLRPN